MPTNDCTLVALSGGIGSGKSVVARMLSVMGYDVYDCDTRARNLIDTNEEIKRAIAGAIGPASIAADGSLDRQYVGSIVFRDKEKLARLNEITHAAVRADLCRWHQNGCKGNVRFVETAILYQSGIDRMVDAVIEVAAPIETRISRIIARNSLAGSEGRQHAIDRINSQQCDIAAPHPVIYHIINDDFSPILPQLQCILHNAR